MPGPGKITIFMYTEFEVQALLYNFDVNSSALKAEHSNWITKEIGVHPPPRPGVTTGPQRTHNMEWLLVGLASRTGSSGRNWNLAKSRARAVSDAIWLLDPGLLPVEIRFGVGEEAARLAGLKDGLEDERWRSVFVRLYDPTKIKIYGPVYRPPVPIERRTYAKFMLKDKPGKSIPMDEMDQRAEAIFQASRQATQYLLDITPSEERMSFVLDTWTVIEVEYWTTNSSGGGWEFEYLEVKYTWGTGSRKLVCSTPGNFKTKQMSDDEMRSWVESPVKAYRTGSSLFQAITGQ
jgi:hypothetical protein